MRKKRFKLQKVLKNNLISIITLCITGITLIVYIIGNHIAQSDVEMQYALNLPNMNVSFDDEYLICKIVNTGGNIREAILIPHMFFELRYCPDFLITDSHVIEIYDFFCKKFDENIYWTSTMPYNVDDNGWIIYINQDELSQGLTLLFNIQKNVEMRDVYSELSLCFEIKYVDFGGNDHIEWYYANYTGDGTLKFIDDNFQTPIEKYLNAKRVDMEEILDNNTKIIQLAKYFEEILSNKK